jgi:hypothetical protein
MLDVKPNEFENLSSRKTKDDQHKWSKKLQFLQGTGGMSGESLAAKQNLLRSQNDSLNESFWNRMYTSNFGQDEDIVPSSPEDDAEDSDNDSVDPTVTQEMPKGEEKKK